MPNIIEPTDFNDLHVMAGIDEVKRQLMPNNQWPEPKPIKQKISPAHSMPEGIIPEPLRPWIADIAYRMQCPMDYVASTAIVMFASLIGSGCGIRPKQKDDWLVIPNLWGCNIGSPSLMKSPSMNEALKPLSRLEVISKESHDDDTKRHEADILEYKASHKAINGKIESAAKSGKHDDMELAKQKFLNLDEPPEPIWQRYKTNDATIEMVSVLLSQNKRGILVVRDEIMGLLNSWEREDKSVDRAYYLEAWNGYGSYTTDRIGRGTIHTENMCVSMFGNTQPDKILRYLMKAIKGDNDGLLQRLQILIYPEENKSNWNLVDEKPDITARDKVYELAEKIASADFAAIGALHDEYKEVHYFHFSADAQEVFYKWLTELETKKIRDTDSDNIVIEHLAKYRSLMPSLALVFHIIDVIDGKDDATVSTESALKAAAWCDYLESHMRRVYSLVQNVSLKAASLLAAKIKSGKLLDKFTARDIYRKQWASLADIEVVKSACDELVDAGWLREVITPAGFQQKEKVEYMINPKVKGKS